MNKGAERQAEAGNPERLAATFKILAITQEPTLTAVDAAIDDQLRVMNIEGNYTREEAVVGLLVDNPTGGTINALNAAREYDLIYGSNISPIVRERLSARNRARIGLR